MRALVLLLLAACDPAPTLDREALLDPESCRSCHPDHVASWEGSMHAYAAQDPVFLAMNARGQRETQGALGDFCVRCHAPMAVREGATTDGLNLHELDPKLKGVTCYFCHSVDTVEGDHDARALQLADDGVLRGAFADAVPNEAHRSGYSTLHDRDHADSAKLCGACHDVVTPGGAHLEQTFLEWRSSVFDAPTGATCGQCHMDQSPDPRPIAVAPGVYARDYHDHAMPAVDVALDPFPHREAQRALVQEQLDATLQSALCVVKAGADASAIRVLLDNVGAGHAFTSGATQDRRLWVEVVAEKDGVELYRSGVVPAGGVVTELDDPDLWLMRSCMFDAQGDEVHMFWEAASAEKRVLPFPTSFDPRDPAYTVTHVVRDFPRGSSSFATVIDGVPDKVTLRVRLQPIGLDVLDDLIGTGDLAPAIRDAMPTFDLDLGAGPVLTWTAEAATATYLEQGVFPVQCVTASNLDVSKPKVAFPEPERCDP